MKTTTPASRPAPRNLSELRTLEARQRELRRDGGPGLLPGNYARLVEGQRLLHIEGSHLWKERDAERSARRCAKFRRVA